MHDCRGSQALYHCAMSSSTSAVAFDVALVALSGRLGIPQASLLSRVKTCCFGELAVCYCVSRMNKLEEEISAKTIIRANKKRKH